MVSSALALGLTVVTLAVFAGLGLWFSRGRVGSVEDLITARGAANEGQLSATLVASVMGVWILLSAPEAGALYGIAAAVGYGLGEAAPMLAYSRLGPRIRELIPEGHSLTEYAYARYGGAMYAFVVVISALYMFVFLAAELTGISLAFHYVAGVPQWQTATLVAGFVLLYTAYGGLRASIATDAVQLFVVLPLLVGSVAALLFALGGTGAVYDGIADANPALLDPGYVPGLRFGAALVFAVLGAELLNQTWWQRIYAGDDSETVERSFRVATVANGFILLLATLLGVVAVGNSGVLTQGAEYNAGVAFFVLLDGAFSEWLVLGVLLLALLLVTSTADSLFNALSSLVTADLPRAMDDPDDRTLRLAARLVTVVVAVAAVAVSLRARSVLSLFFVADLLGAAVGIPLVYGLFTGGLSGRGALVSALLGLAVGSAFFPFPFGLHGAADSLLGGLLPAPDPTYLLPFAGAFLVSSASAVVAARLSSSEFDLDRLSREIRRLDRPVTDGGTPSNPDEPSESTEPSGPASERGDDR
ncbi:Na+/proline symporter [Halogeometricum pallidum JCM 14848]|uniref:Na+/proline symporter n=1 Tax=Halogeometricum pallidum JCM 14848 TaxID=1227487 RepID=M0D838_HALPD|nr:Na+/proline symporter [Halogeometricum pallidum]ELZ31636.1 Na+/proline symporter [Halogeometricum pallidum JCM 14848]